MRLNSDTGICARFNMLCIINLKNVALARRGSKVEAGLRSLTER